MNIMVYFLLFPQTFKRDLGRNIDNKLSMDLDVNSHIFPYVFNHDLKRKMDNKDK